MKKIASFLLVIIMICSSLVLVSCEPSDEEKAEAKKVLDSWYTEFKSGDKCSDMLAEKIAAMDKIVADAAGAIDSAESDDALASATEDTKNSVQSYYDANKNTKSSSINAAKEELRKFLNSESTYEKDGKIYRVYNDRQHLVDSAFDESGKSLVEKEYEAQIGAIDSADLKVQSEINEKINSAKESIYRVYIQNVSEDSENFTEVIK